MKRVRVYKEIISDENLRRAILEVNAGHRRNGNHSLNKTVIEIENNVDEYVEKLRTFIQGLVDGDEHMHPPLKRRRWDRNADSGKGKWREINEPRLWPDQYVHHAVVQPMIPHIMRSMDRYCIASVPGRGNSYGVKALKKNFPTFKQGEIALGAFGPATVKTVEEEGLRIDLEAPTKEFPSMTGALKDYLKRNNKK